MWWFFVVEKIDVIDIIFLGCIFVRVCVIIFFIDIFVICVFVIFSVFNNCVVFLVICLSLYVFFGDFFFNCCNRLGCGVLLCIDFFVLWLLK